jgi:peptidoglycan/LPS O-acetylase OafA/YrhL
MPNVVRAGVPGAMLVFGSVFLEKHETISFNHLLIKLGDSSYSLYLVHIFSINAVGKVWHVLIGGLYELFVFVAILTSVIVGYLSYLFIGVSHWLLTDL